MVTNTSRLQSRKNQLFRIGLKFLAKTYNKIEDFYQCIKSPTILCKSAIRPQAYCPDPFFYNEKVYFKVEGFSHKGVVLTTSKRCKSILPKHQFQLDIFIPGAKLFTLEAKNSDFFYHSSSNILTLFIEISSPPESYTKAITEYLLLFTPDTTPGYLRQIGFSIQNLQESISVHHQSLGDNILSDQNFKISDLFQSIEPSIFQRIKSKSKPLSLKIGSQLAVNLQLTYLDQNGIEVVFTNHQDLDETFAEECIFAHSLYESPYIKASDYLFSLITHLARITIQSSYKNLIIKTHPQWVTTLAKLGFKEINIQSKLLNHNTDQSQFMCLQAKQTILNKNKVIESGVWDKVYKSLYQYFKNQVTR